MAIGDVVINRVIEQDRVLRHDANGAAHTVLGQLLDVLTVDADAAFLRIVKTKQQAGQCRFTGTRRAHHRHGFASRNRQADAMQNRPICFVGKKYLVKTDFGWLCQLKSLGGSQVCDLTLLFKQLKHAF